LGFCFWDLGHDEDAFSFGSDLIDVREKVAVEEVVYSIRIEIPKSSEEMSI